MSLQFSRSLRSLRVDSFKAARVGMIFGVLLMGLLILWFFLARITLYENSLSLELREDGIFLAEFSNEGIQRIRQGQSVLIRIDRGPDRPTETLTGIIYDLKSDSNQVELVTTGFILPEDLKIGKIGGRVDVEVDYLTPAQLLIRATGKYLTKNEIPVSPQNPQP